MLRKKGELLAQIQQIRDEQSTVMDTTRHDHEKKLEQLRQDMNDDFDKRYKEQGDELEA